MINQFILLSIAAACLSSTVNGRIIFHRKENVSDNLKQLDLPPEEFDQNVAPPSTHQQIATIDPQEASANSPSSVSLNNASGGTNGANDVVSESISSSSPPIAQTSVSAAGIGLHQPTTTKKPEPSGFSKYCKCTESHCNCCRNIGIPILSVRNPGCAKITYLGDEKISVSLKYGDVTLASRTISGKKAKPLCVGFPGGDSKFCGRVYGLSKIAEDFKACLGFELRSDDEVEAALRVSCFKFGPSGLRIIEPEPLPSQVEDGDDDDDDIFGFGGDDDDDEDYDGDDGDDVDGDDGDDYRNVNYPIDEYTEAPEDADYSGFSFGSLLEEFADDDQEKKTTKKVKKSKLNSTRIISGRKDDVMQDKTAIQRKDESGNEGIVIDDGQYAALEQIPETSMSTESSFGAVTTTTAVHSTRQGIKKYKTSSKKDNDDYSYDLINGIVDIFN